MRTYKSTKSKDAISMPLSKIFYSSDDESPLTLYYQSSMRTNVDNIYICIQCHGRMSDKMKTQLQLQTMDGQLDKTVPRLCDTCACDCLQHLKTGRQPMKGIMEGEKPFRIKNKSFYSNNKRPILRMLNSSSFNIKDNTKISSVFNLNTTNPSKDQEEDSTFSQLTRMVDFSPYPVTKLEQQQKQLPQVDQLSTSRQGYGTDFNIFRYLSTDLQTCVLCPCEVHISYCNGDVVPDLLLDEDISSHLFRSENQLRLTDEIQDLYRFVRKSFPSLLLEDHIQRLVMAQHGVVNLADSQLSQYRIAMSETAHLPNIKKHAFFLRNNIIKDGLPVGSEVDPNISFETLSDSGTDEKTTLGTLLNRLRETGKKLIILCGSLT